MKAFNGEILGWFWCFQYWNLTWWTRLTRESSH